MIGKYGDNVELPYWVVKMADSLIANLNKGKVMPDPLTSEEVENMLDEIEARYKSQPTDKPL